MGIWRWRTPYPTHHLPVRLALLHPKTALVLLVTGRTFECQENRPTPRRHWQDTYPIGG